MLSLRRPHTRRSRTARRRWRRRQPLSGCSSVTRSISSAAERRAGMVALQQDGKFSQKLDVQRPRFGARACSNCARQQLEEFGNRGIPSSGRLSHQRCQFDAFGLAPCGRVQMRTLRGCVLRGSCEGWLPCLSKGLLPLWAMTNSSAAGAPDDEGRKISATVRYNTRSHCRCVRQSSQARETIPDESVKLLQAKIALE